MSGIGFLGAGTIIIQKLFVRGLTTAAGIWATSAIGLAVGAGQYWLGISAMLLTLLGLEGLGYLFQKISQRNVSVSYTHLDVYKRQDLVRANKEQEIQTLGERIQSFRELAEQQMQETYQKLMAEIMERCV